MPSARPSGAWRAAVSSSTARPFSFFRSPSGRSIGEAAQSRSPGWRCRSPSSTGRPTSSSRCHSLSTFFDTRATLPRLHGARSAGRPLPCLVRQRVLGLPVLARAGCLPRQFRWQLLEGAVRHSREPFRALFVFTPVFLFALPAGAAAFRSAPPGSRRLVRYLVVGAVAMIAVYSFWSMWWGGHTFGYRLITEIAPLLTILVASYWPRVSRNRVAAVAFGLCLLFSLYVHLLGAIVFPSGFNNGLDGIPSVSGRSQLGARAVHSEARPASPSPLRGWPPRSSRAGVSPPAPAWWRPDLEDASIRAGSMRLSTASGSPADSRRRVGPGPPGTGGGARRDLSRWPRASGRAIPSARHPALEARVGRLLTGGLAHPGREALRRGGRAPPSRGAARSQWTRPPRLARSPSDGWADLETKQEESPPPDPRPGVSPRRVWILPRASHRVLRGRVRQLRLHEHRQAADGRNAREPSADPPALRAPRRPAADLHPSRVRRRASSRHDGPLLPVGISGAHGRRGPAPWLAAGTVPRRSIGRAPGRPALLPSRARSLALPSLGGGRRRRVRRVAGPDRPGDPADERLHGDLLGPRRGPLRPEGPSPERLGTRRRRGSRDRGPRSPGRSASRDPARVCAAGHAPGARALPDRRNSFCRRARRLRHSLLRQPASVRLRQDRFARSGVARQLSTALSPLRRLDPPVPHAVDPAGVDRIRGGSKGGLARPGPPALLVRFLLPLLLPLQAVRFLLVRPISPARRSRTDPRRLPGRARSGHAASEAPMVDRCRRRVADRRFLDGGTLDPRRGRC